FVTLSQGGADRQQRGGGQAAVKGDGDLLGRSKLTHPNLLARRALQAVRAAEAGHHEGLRGRRRQGERGPAQRRPSLFFAAKENLDLPRLSRTGEGLDSHVCAYPFWKIAVHPRIKSE